MFKPLYNKRPIIEECQALRVSNTIRSLYLEAKKYYKHIYKEELDFNNEESVKKFIDLVKDNFKVNLIQTTNDKTHQTKPNPINLTYTKSNLGKGFIFWFVCNGCGRKFRFLYFTPYSEELLCRNCHHLAYEKQNKRSDSLIKELIKNPERIVHYVNYGNLKQLLAVIQANEIVQKAKLEAQKIFDKIRKNSSKI
jgi:cell division septum initiation protein DivIVA